MIVYPVARPLADRPKNSFLLAPAPAGQSWRVEWTKTFGTYPDFYADTQAQAMFIAAGIASPGDVLEILSSGPRLTYIAVSSRGGKADIKWEPAGK
jgi:hypothetical protein